MNTQNLKTAAPMPGDKSKIANSPMKLYSYLICISGLADYPDHTRMFRQKDIMLSKVKEAIGLDPKTTKLYLFYLEARNLIVFNGKHCFDNGIKESCYENHKEYRKAAQKNAIETWTLRYKEEKNAVYYIPRPTPYTPVPELTLEQLNKDFEITELELKIYLICCRYRDECCYLGRSFKVLTFENIRDILGAKLNTWNDNAIRRALVFLRGIGLIEYQEGSIVNRKNAKIPSFYLKEVNYYIGKITEFSSSLKEDQDIIDRIAEGFSKTSN